MRCFTGIDLGSTTTKAVLLDQNMSILGRGITNSRSSYDTASQLARREAIISARLTLLHRGIGNGDGMAFSGFLAGVERHFRLEQYLEQLEELGDAFWKHLHEERFRDKSQALESALDEIMSHLRQEALVLFAPSSRRKSDFFRDIAGSRFMQLGEKAARNAGLDFDLLLNLYDKSIIAVESRPPSGDMDNTFFNALERTLAQDSGAKPDASQVRRAMEQALAEELEDGYTVGTGYGRVRLPFPKEHIRSEILCHGLGAHLMYPGTRTVLDIGGQDTKAIQVDGQGIVENFQMNDRCAAGCGRYLGYIADEMNLGLHELGPLALSATRTTRINSTCTVFAGAELHDRLALGEKRENILGGLHRAIILRAMSLLARSGGVRDQFTFTGGVAHNQAAVKELKQLVKENYGEVTVNINPDSIYTGALGAAAFAYRAVD